MFRSVQDVAYPSAQVYPPNSTGAAFQIIPNLEGFDASVLDDRAFPAPGIPLGTLYVEDFFATSTQGDAQYAPSNRYGQSVPLFSYGILTSVPLVPQGYNAAQLQAATGSPNQTGLSYGGPTELRIRQKGTCSALCTTPSAAAPIAVGTLLTADGNGNLCPFQPPSAAPTPAVTPVGTTGAATWAYKLVAVSADGVATALGTAGQTTTGNATLTGANYNQITWTPVEDASYYIIVRTAVGTSPNTVGTIGIVDGGDGADPASFNDTGLAIQANTTATQPFPTLSAPGAPTVAQVAGATAGTTTDTYTVYAIGADGLWSPASGATSITTAAATLTPTQGNKITWTAVVGAVSYAIFRTAAGGTPSSTGWIGYSNNPTGGFIDYGQAANTAVVTQTIPNPTPRNGALLGTAKGVLAGGTTTPTLVLVQVGGS